MKVRRLIRKRLERQKDGVQVAAGVNAVVSANVNEPGSSTRASSRQRVVQRNGRTIVESEDEQDPPGPHTGDEQHADERSVGSSELGREHAEELPDREGTYDELRREATRRRDENARRGAAADEVQITNEGKDHE
jgi:hypothetical protein